MKGKRSHISDQSAPDQRNSTSACRLARKFSKKFEWQIVELEHMRHLQARTWLSARRKSAGKGDLAGGFSRHSYDDVNCSNALSRAEVAPRLVE